MKRPTMRGEMSAWLNTALSAESTILFLLKLCFERYVRYLVRMLDRTRPDSGVGAASARRGPGARGRRADGATERAPQRQNAKKRIAS